ncbi:MAG TPA: hypothetical protein VGL61_20730 [Kofleriaceae bacterium]|jgi:hypothetical protein
MRCACLIALGLIGCAVTFPIPTARMPIHYVGRGNLRKGGAALDGFTCGERYEDAVSGVPAAEAEMRACWKANVVYGLGIGLALVAVPGAFVTEHYGGSRTAVGAEAGFAAASFLVGYIAAFVAGHHLNRAIDIYNEAIR